MLGSLKRWWKAVTSTHESSAFASADVDLLPCEARVLLTESTVSGPFRQLIDNDDAGFTTSGTWTRETVSGYGGDYHIAAATDAVASWTFSSLQSGRYRIAASWQTWGAYQDQARFSAFDASLATPQFLRQVDVDQRQAPNSFVQDGVQWQNLGEIRLTGSVLRISLQAADGATITRPLFADAVRIERIEPFRQVIDNGNTGFTTVGRWATETNRGFGGDYAVTATAGASASWTFFGLEKGRYRVSTTWFHFGSYQNRAEYTARDVSGANPEFLRRFNIDQRQQPTSFTQEGTPWQNLGEVELSGSVLRITLRNTVGADDARVLFADAVQLERIDSFTQVIDNQDQGYSELGSWSRETVRGYGGDYSVAASATARATWAFANLAPGTYRIAATWQNFGSYQNLARFTVTDASTPRANFLRQFEIDQREASTGFREGGSTWRNLGEVTLSGSVLQVVLEAASDAEASRVLFADAIRIERVEEFSQVIDNDDAGYEQTGAWSHETTRGYGRDYAVASTSDAEARWTFRELRAGTYRVFGTWFGFGTYQSQARFTMRDVTNGASQVLTTTDVDQRVAPNGMQDGDEAWQNLATVTLAGNELEISLAAAPGAVASRILYADAIRIERVETTSQVIDNGDAGFTTTGTWAQETGLLNVGGDYAVATGAATARWTFTGLRPGQAYAVYATWGGWGTYQRQAQFVGIDRNATDSPQVLSRTVDQSIGRLDRNMLLEQFLGNATVNGGTLEITLSAAAGANPSGILFADSVRIVNVPVSRI